MEINIVIMEIDWGGNGGGEGELGIVFCGLDLGLDRKQCFPLLCKGGLLETAGHLPGTI